MGTMAMTRSKTVYGEGFAPLMVSYPARASIVYSSADLWMPCATARSVLHPLPLLAPGRRSRFDLAG